MYLADAYSDTLIYLNVFCFCLFVFWQFKERSDESCRNKFIMLIWPRNLDHKIKETLSFSDIYSSTYECPYFELNISLSFANALARGYPRLIQSRNASQQKILKTVLFLCLRNSIIFVSPFGRDRRLRYAKTNAILHQGPAVCVQTMRSRSTILICSLFRLVSRSLLCQRLQNLHKLQSLSRLRRKLFNIRGKYTFCSRYKLLELYASAI